MSKDKSLVGLEEILKELGPFGKYNIINYALLLFPCFLAGMYGSVFVFEAAAIDYRCKIPECETLNQSLWLDSAIPKELNKDSYVKCSRYSFKENVTLSNDTCTGIFHSNKTEACYSYAYSDADSAVIDFNLGCQEWKRTLIGTIHNSGLFVSLPLTGFVSDRFGRKKALAIASLMNCIFGFSRSFAPNYYVMVILEFCEAAMGAGAYSTAFVLAMELVGPKGRVFGNTLINIVFVFGLMTLSGLSWILQSWRTLLRVIYAPACLVFTYLWILNESVRWLLSKGRHDEAVAILQKAAKINKVQLTDQLLSPLQEMEKMKPVSEKREMNEAVVNTTPIYIQVLRSNIIRRRVMTCSYLWITCTFVYYGLSINSVSLAGNKYVNFMLVAFVEIPANLCCLYVLDRFGRKRVMIIMYIVSAILCISLSFIPKGWISLIVYLSGKFSITVAYSSVYIYVSEVFPTNVRQSLLAVCSATGRIGSTLAPLTPVLALYYANLPSIFFGTLAVIAGLLVFTLPETINVPLPDSIEEAERLSREKKQNYDA